MNERRENIQDLYEKAAKIARIKGYVDDAEDFAGWITIKWLEGKAQHQTLSQSLIDYLRSHYGSDRLYGSTDALSRKRRGRIGNGDSGHDAETFEEALDRVQASSGHYAGLSGQLEDDFRPHRSVILDERLLGGSLLDCYRAIRSGLAIQEIATAWHVDISRVCFLTRQLERLTEEQYLWEEILPAVREGKRPFEVDWIRL